MKLVELSQLLEKLLKVYPDDTEVGVADINGFHKFVMYTDIYKNEVVVCIDMDIEA